MRPKPVAIYGAGGFAREVAWLVERCNQAGGNWELRCFIDDDETLHGRRLNGHVVMGLDEACHRFPDAQVVVAVGAPRTRQAMAEKAASKGFGFATLIAPDAQYSKWVDIGEGTVICAGNILTVNISIGPHAQINLGCTIGHDVVLGEYTTLSPGVHVSGWVHMGRRVYVGTGASFTNGREGAPLLIGEDAIIGAQACVVKPVPAGSTTVGVPAKPIKMRSHDESP